MEKDTPETHESPRQRKEREARERQAGREDALLALADRAGEALRDFTAADMTRLVNLLRKDKRLQGYDNSVIHAVAVAAALRG